MYWDALTLNVLEAVGGRGMQMSALWGCLMSAGATSTFAKRGASDEQGRREGQCNKREPQPEAAVSFRTVVTLILEQVPN